MNPLKNTIAINKVYRGFRKYLKNVPAIRAAQARGDHAEAQRIIRRGEDYFCDHTGASLGIKVDVINPENIPTEGPYLVVANHQSYADIYALIDAFRSTQIGFIAKSETKSSNLLPMSYVEPSLYLSTAAIHALQYKRSKKLLSCSKTDIRLRFSRRVREAIATIWGTSNRAALNLHRKPRFQSCRFRLSILIKSLRSITPSTPEQSRW